MTCILYVQPKTQINLGFGIWDFGIIVFGIWDLGFGQKVLIVIWDLEFEIWALGFGI